jgi:hypothetical protein
MIQTVQSVTGNTGYRDQLDRARRFLDRILASPQDNGDSPSEVEFQDNVWAFFQNCWHVKDWVESDPLASPAQKNAVLAEAHRSSLLKICKQMCNGTKHLEVRKGEAQHSYVETTGIPGYRTFSMDCLIDDGAGNSISSKDLGRQCIAEWERILSAQGLAITRRS